MSYTDKEKILLRHLLVKSLDGNITPEEIDQFNQLLTDFPGLEDYYLQCMNVHVALSDERLIAKLKRGSTDELDQKKRLLNDLAEFERVASVQPIDKESEPASVEESVSVQVTKSSPTPYKMSRFSFLAVAASLLIFIGMITYVHMFPSVSYPVATVCDSIDAVWTSTMPITPGTKVVFSSEPITLIQGIVKLQTENQNSITLEAPAEFYFSSDNDLIMNYGRLFAHVSEQGLGFTVATPNSKVIDLGTEFGIISDRDGTTEVHMFKGKANIFAGEKKQIKTSQMLTAGSAVQVDRKNAVVRSINLNKQAVVRDIIGTKTKFAWRGQKLLRLSDILLGGDGFGTATQPNIEFDPGNGQVVTSGYAGYRQGGGKRLPVPNKYVDSIFVPGSSNGKEIISSKGHRFAECPQTSGQYFANVLCQKDFTFFDPVQQHFTASKQFPDPGFLYLHSNVGLTFDLNAIRKKVPGLSLTSFTAFLGVIQTWNEVPENSEADVWILVDGQLKFSQLAVRVDQSYDLKIDLSDTDQFLTLIVTDGGKVYTDGYPANHYDTIGFAEPAFTLALP